MIVWKVVDLFMIGDMNFIRFLFWKGG